MMQTRKNLLVAPALLLALLVNVHCSDSDHENKIPSGWYSTGTDPGSYAISVEKSEGANVLTIRSIATDIDSFTYAGAMQTFRAGDYQGKRIRVSASLRSQGIAAFWMRVNLDPDGNNPGDQSAAISRIEKDAWEEHTLVLDVPLHARSVALGAWQTGMGQVWMKNLHIDIVDSTVAVSEPMKADHGEEATADASGKLLQSGHEVRATPHQLRQAYISRVAVDCRPTPTGACPIWAKPLNLSFE